MKIFLSSGVTGKTKRSLASFHFAMRSQVTASTKLILKIITYFKIQVFLSLSEISFVFWLRIKTYGFSHFA